jgi:hypothetical protein
MQTLDEDAPTPTVVPYDNKRQERTKGEEKRLKLIRSAFPAGELTAHYM